MDTKALRAYARFLAWLLAAALTVYAAASLIGSWKWWVAGLPVTSFLLVPLLYCGWRSRREAHGPVSRVGLTFILTALALLPSPSALWLAGAGLAAGGGGGMLATRGRGITGAVAFGTAVAVADFLAGLFHWPIDLASPLVLAPLAFLFVIVTGFTLALELAFAAGEPDAPALRPADWSAACAGVVNLPLAFLLAPLLDRGAWVAAGAVTLFVLSGAEVAERLRRLRHELDGNRASLDSRIRELEALRAIGGEILTTLDVETLYRLLDRECRKMFDVDAASVALADSERSCLRQVFNRVGARVHVGERTVRSGLAARVLRSGRPLLVADVADLPPDGSLQANLLDPETRSAMAVPLRVEDGIVGVFTIESRTPHTYDEHRLSVLTTIGQQAAVAIENARHYQMATVDALTGFFVKEYFFRRLRQEDQRVRRYGGRFALVMIDLDCFKEINDTFGHLAGDKLLAEITGTIRKQLRRNDLACRYGGDEFCLLLPDAEIEGAQAIAERIRREVAERVVLFKGQPLRTTVSIGLACYPDHDGGDLEGLLENADAALYRAKRGGRDRVCNFAA